MWTVILLRLYFNSIWLSLFINFLCGNNEHTVEMSHSYYSFDTENNTWETMMAMKDDRFCASAAILNGYIYMAGGFTFTKSSQDNSVVMYDPRTNEWTGAAGMNKPRRSFTLLESNGFLYAMGGNRIKIERFDPFKNAWTEVCEANLHQQRKRPISWLFRVAFQIGSLEGSDHISDAINVDGKFLAIKKNGTFGRVEVDESGKCSFISLGKSKYKSSFLERHLLFHVWRWNQRNDSILSIKLRFKAKFENKISIFVTATAYLSSTNI